jgi:hypothetical protein
VEDKTTHEATSWGTNISFDQTKVTLSMETDGVKIQTELDRDALIDWAANFLKLAQKIRSAT